ncbi:MAG: DUF4390 domain-containing protein [Gammaproteobacteria bacterium]
MNVTVPFLFPADRMRVLRTLIVMAVLAGCTTAFAQEDATSGRFEVRSAYTQELDGVYHVSAQIDYGLTDAAIEALTNGVPLTFKLEISVERQRRWLPDDTEHELLQRYELSFHALTERYIVRNLNSGEQNSFGTLSSALRGLGEIDRLPVIDASLLNAERDYRIAMRTTLDIKSLSGPLRLLASLFRIGDWRLASDWHAWALNP